jgi:hypothetical protein
MSSIRLGEDAAVKRHYEQACCLFEQLQTADPLNAQAQRDLAGAHVMLVNVYKKRGPVAVAREHGKRALALYERLQKADPKHVPTLKDMAALYGTLGNLEFAENDIGAATAMYERGVAVLKGLEAKGQGNFRPPTRPGSPRSDSGSRRAGARTRRPPPGRKRSARWAPPAPITCMK